MSENDNTQTQDTEISQVKSIEQLEHHIEDLSDRLLRAIAESENIRRRYEKQMEEMRDYSVTSFAKDLISVVDNLERAIQFQPNTLPEEAKSIMEGVLMTHKELASVLQKHGITSIEPKKGEKFDYNVHFAISEVDTNEHDQGAIVGLMQVGYKIKDRLLRPASVSVAKRKE